MANFIATLRGVIAKIADKLARPYAFLCRVCPRSISPGVVIFFLVMFALVGLCKLAGLPVL